MLAYECLFVLTMKKCVNNRDKTRKLELLEVLHCHKLSVGQRMRRQQRT